MAKNEEKPRTIRQETPGAVLLRQEKYAKNCLPFAVVRGKLENWITDAYLS